VWIGWVGKLWSLLLGVVWLWSCFSGWWVWFLGFISRLGRAGDGSYVSGHCTDIRHLHGVERGTLCFGALPDTRHLHGVEWWFAISRLGLGWFVLFSPKVPGLSLLRSCVCGPSFDTHLAMGGLQGGSGRGGLFRLVWRNIGVGGWHSLRMCFSYVSNLLGLGKGWFRWDFLSISDRMAGRVWLGWGA
jgi:hypothetical protein